MAVTMQTQTAAQLAARSSKSSSSSTEPRSDLEVATRAREEAAPDVDDDDLYANLAHTD